MPAKKKPLKRLAPGRQAVKHSIVGVPGWPDNITGSDVARGFGVTRQSAASWKLPQNPDGTYSMSVCINHRIKHAVAEAAHRMRAGAPVGAPAVEDLDRKEKELKIRLAQFRLAEKCGQVVRRDVVEAAFGKSFTAMKTMLLGLSTGLAQRLQEKPATVIGAEIDSAVRDVLKNGQKAFRQGVKDVD